jgi:hypothetical protein
MSLTKIDPIGGVFGSVPENLLAISQSKSLGLGSKLRALGVDRANPRSPRVSAALAAGTDQP